MITNLICAYLLGRCEVGTHHWAQCNDIPVNYARFPVTGLVEGRSYVFRVQALNKVGVSRPSRVSEAVVAMDPSDRARLQGQKYTKKTCNTATGPTTACIHASISFIFSTAGPSAPWTGMIKFTEEDPTGMTNSVILQCFGVLYYYVGLNTGLHYLFCTVQHL